MSQIHNSIEIACPIELVFDFATTPGHWAEWHPSTIAVTGDTDHSLEPGEQVTEDFRAARRNGRAVWTVKEREAPYRWVIAGVAESGGTATITYSFTKVGAGTRFDRDLVYSHPGLIFAILDKLLGHRLLATESEQALRQLKELLEGESDRLCGRR